MTSARKRYFSKGDFASVETRFRLCGHEAVDGARLAAFRSPPPPLRPSLIDCIENKRRQVAAALSAAVTTTKQQETASNLQAESSQKNRTRQTPAALRERGSGGEALLLEKRPLPRETSYRSLSGREREGGAFLEERLPPSHTLLFSHNFFAKGLALFGKMGYNKDVSFANVRVLR